MMDRGQIGLLAVVENEPVGYCWAILGANETVTPVNDIVSLAKGEAYIHFCRTLDEYRGNGIYPWLLSVMAAHLFEHRHTATILIDTTTANMASRRGIERVGFRPARTVTRLTVFGSQIWIGFRPGGPSVAGWTH